MSPSDSIGSLLRGRPARRILIVLLVILLILVVARALLPYFLRQQINQRFSRLEGYHGHIEGVDMSLWRGAYQLVGLSLSRIVDGEPQPVLDAREVDFSVRWKDLFEGRIRSEILATDITFIHVPVESEEETAEFDLAAWRAVISDLFPIEIDYLAISNGRVEYRDDDATPPVDVSLEAIELVVTGLSNRAVGTETDELPAGVAVEGTTIGGGFVNARMTADPLAEDPLFDLDLSIENVSLPALNDYLQAYGNVDVSSGNLNFYTEISARDGRFEGYVKPLFDNVSFKDLDGDPDRGVAASLWEGFISVMAEIFENQSRDQVGTSIPISGEFGSAEAGFWTALGNLFRHGFIRALTEGIDGQSLDESTPDPPEEGGE